MIKFSLFNIQYLKMLDTIKTHLKATAKALTLICGLTTSTANAAEKVAYNIQWTLTHVHLKNTWENTRLDSLDFKALREIQENPWNYVFISGEKDEQNTLNQRISMECEDIQIESKSKSWIDSKKLIWENCMTTFFKLDEERSSCEQIEWLFVEWWVVAILVREIISDSAIEKFVSAWGYWIPLNEKSMLSFANRSTSKTNTL